MVTRRKKIPPAKQPKEQPNASATPAAVAFPPTAVPGKGMAYIPAIDRGEALAIQALATGTANSNQQIIGLKLIVERFADYGGVCLDPQEALAHNGRRFVAICILQALNKSD